MKVLVFINKSLQFHDMHLANPGYDFLKLSGASDIVAGKRHQAAKGLSQWDVVCLDIARAKIGLHSKTLADTSRQ